MFLIIKYMDTIVMKLHPEPFEEIKSGKKKIELRLYDEKRKNINLGDIIEFKKEPEQTETIKTKVVALLRYNNFSDLFDDFDLGMFGDKSKNELLEGVARFYSEDQQKENGVLGIKIELA